MQKWTAFVFLTAFLHLSAHAENYRLAPETDQLIIKFKQQSESTLSQQPLEAARIRTLSAIAGTPLVAYRTSQYGQIVKLPHKTSLYNVHEIAKRIASSPDVLYAEPDKRVFPLNTPSDPNYYKQWNLQGVSMSPGGINLPNAWDITTGLFSVVVAVIDTGVLSHADLDGRMLPGYDFVTDISKANDGDGRDSDPSDPGDWVTTVESTTTFSGCPVSNSTWHGTHVAGIIGATTNNGLGIAGINWGSRILPVRVMGKCGGYISDITDGMRWAVGLPVPGSPANTNPAKILNLSLGGDEACSITEQNAINDAVNMGAVVVVAAGNDAQNAANVSPANCNNVIVVAATDKLGSRASYTNFGSLIDISAPGGDINYGGGGILALGDSGLTTPKHDNTYVLKQGTSMATPHVSGVVSLMLSANPMLTPSSIKNILKSTARTFPTGTTWDCTALDCGSGILDASAALNASYTGAIPVQISGIPSGGLRNLTLQATIKPRTEDLNKMVNLYVGAKIGNQWFLRSNTNWMPWAGGALPIFNSTTAIPVISLEIGRDVDASGLVGTEIYVGYGSNDADLLDQNKYGLIYTVH